MPRINDAIVRVGRDFSPFEVDDAGQPFICECFNKKCRDTIYLPLAPPKLFLGTEQRGER